MLIYNVNFFCIYLCFIYCYTLYSTGKHFQKVKIIIAIIVTCIGLIVNILYWAIMKKGDVKSDKSV
jgi:Co/Zn/Cd efflux system component